MAKKPHKSGASGVIHNAGGDKGAYLGHYRSAKVMKHGHNQGAPPRAFNPNPVSDPQGVGATPKVPAMRASSIAAQQEGARNRATKMARGKGQAPFSDDQITAARNRLSDYATDRPVAPVKNPRQTTGVPRMSRDAGMAGRPVKPDTGMQLGDVSQQPMNPRAAAAQKALESLRQSVGQVRQSRQSARSILGGVNANKGRGIGKG